MQDFWDIIKTPNLQIMDIEGEEKQTIGIENIFNKIIVDCFPRLEKEMVIQTDKNRKNLPTCHIIFKTLGKNIESSRAKNPVTYKNKLIRITVDFATEILKERRHGMMYFKPQKKIFANLNYCTQQNYA
jgi:hypothetical protein